MTTRWPLVVGYLLETLPTLPGWSGLQVFDTDPLTASAPPAYAVVARTVNDTSSGTYSRAVHTSGLIVESGVVRVELVTRSGSADAGVGPS
jgi:hypothetical protein